MHSAVEVHSFSLHPRIKLVETPAPRYGEVVVKILLRPVNPSDVMSIKGALPGLGPVRLPAVPGSDGVGIVAALGRGVVGKFRIGQRVAGIPFPSSRGNGSWQQFAAVDECNLVAIPDEVSDIAASQFFINPVAALGLFETVAAPPGEYILNGAAGSALGRMISSIAVHRGVKVINVVRRREAASGITIGEVVVTEDEDVFSRVMSITGGLGVWGALDPVGGEDTSTAGRATRVGGTVVVYGMLGGSKSAVSISDMIIRDVRVRGFRLATWLRRMNSAEKRAKMDEVMGLIAVGVIPTVDGERFPLSNAGVKAALEVTGRPGAPKVFLESY
jgi:NADPH:quinone reductase-like Zn-dependent oxidoreductase